MHNSSQVWSVRHATAADRAFLEALAPRLTIGIPPWRDPAVMLATVRRWLADDLARMRTDATAFIVEASDGTPVGAATIARSSHFTEIGAGSPVP